jgi:hypothetical protein
MTTQSVSVLSTNAPIPKIAEQDSAHKRADQRPQGGPARYFRQERWSNESGGRHPCRERVHDNESDQLPRLDIGGPHLALLPCELIKTDGLLPFQFLPNRDDCSASESNRERYDWWLRLPMTKFPWSPVRCQVKHKQETTQYRSSSKELAQVYDDRVVRFAVRAAHNEQNPHNDRYGNSSYKPEGYEG